MTTDALLLLLRKVRAWTDEAIADLSDVAPQPAPEPAPKVDGRKTPEFAEKMRAAAKARWAKAKAPAKPLHWTQTPEGRAKLAGNRLGKKHSPEAKAAIAEGLRRRHAARKAA